MHFPKAALFIIGGVFLGAIFSLSQAKAQSSDLEPAFKENFYDVEARGNLCWIVGYYGTILHSKDRGRTWRVQKGRTRDALFRVGFTSRQNGWVSGSNGTILHTRDGGQHWKRQRIPTTEHLLGLNFINEHTGWVVGSRGTVMHTETGGASWTDQSIKDDVILNDVYFVTPKRGWAVGEFGRIYTTTDGGRAWIKQKSPVEVSFISGESRNLFRLLLLKPRDVGKGTLMGWAFGLDGVILRTRDGRSWDNIHSDGSGPDPVRHHIFDAAVYNGKKWAVGERGTVIFSPKGDGRWERASLRAPPLSLNGIAFGSKGFGLIVGNRGLVLHTEDGGRRWNRIQITSVGTAKGVSKTLP